MDDIAYMLSNTHYFGVRFRLEILLFTSCAFFAHFFLLLAKSTLPMGFHQPSTISKSVVSCVFVEIYRTRFLCQQQPTSSDIVQFQYTSIYWMNNIFSNNKKKMSVHAPTRDCALPFECFFFRIFLPQSSTSMNQMRQDCTCVGWANDWCYVAALPSIADVERACKWFPFNIVKYE